MEVGSVMGNMKERPDVLAVSAQIESILELPPYFQQGKCIGSDPVIFDGESLIAVLEAKKICAMCPIQSRCLEWAVQTQNSGVWGGATPNERRKLSGDNVPADISELQMIQTNASRIMSKTPTAQLAVEFGVTPRTIFRWRNQIKTSKKASQQ